jgi:formylglycine-generating enzyme required for sulfatase activity
MSWGFGITNNAIGYPNTLWMYGTGFVGIGTNAPSQQLEVNGSALIDGAITATNFVGNGSGLTGLNPANLSAGTAAINISGSAATANTLTSLASPPPTPSLIVCWGDSLTGAYDCASQAYGNYLSGLLNIPVNIQSFPGASSSIILSNFLAAPNLWGYPTIIWSGRNDFTGTNTVLGDIATMVSDLNSVGNSNYLVMSIINMENEYSGSTNPTSGYYFTITNLNHYLSATYPNNFFDVREYLVNAANTNLPQDLWTFTNDIPADSLRCSPGDVHLNNAGYFTVANGILQTSFLNQNIYVFSEGKTRSLISETLANPPAIGLITPNSINATSINASTAITVGGGSYNSTLSPGELVLSASNFTNAVMIQSQPRGVSGNGYPVDSWYCSANYGLYLNRYYTTGNMSWGFGITNNAIGYPNTLWMYGTGFVGIGTNAPSQQLEVNGNAKIDGTVTATNFVGNGGGLTNVTATALATPQGMALIPAGLFTMGDSLDGESDATPTNITVSAFYMDINLVSYAQWQSVYFWAINHGYGFVYVGAGRAANHPVQTMLWYDSVKWSNARSQQAGLTPVYYTDAGLTQVYTNNIPDAIYPNWAANGYRLPTEAEWEKAARGGLSGQRFPWGNVITENLANYSGNTGYSYDLGPNGYNAAFTNVWPYTSQVGYFAPNGYGLYDMAGNVSEWCWDWYGTPYGQPTNTNPTGPATGGNRVIRGGSWDSSAYFTRCAARNSVTIVAEPAAAYSDLGFRCVRGH